MPNPVRVFNLTDIDGEARSACMGVIKTLGGYAESMPSPSPEVQGSVVMELAFAIKRGSPAVVGTVPWSDLAMVALNKLSATSRAAVIREALTEGFPKSTKPVVEKEVEAMRATLRIANGTRPGNITGTISGQARFS